MKLRLYLQNTEWISSTKVCVYTVIPSLKSYPQKPMPLKNSLLIKIAYPLLKSHHEIFIFTKKMARWTCEAQELPMRLSSSCIPLHR